MGRTVAAVVVLGACLGGASGARAQEATGCATCHEKEYKAELGTVHAKNPSACIDCHGGDPKASDKDRAHGPGFAGKIGRAAVPGSCAKCHSDPRRMNPTGLPTDQHAQYLTSRHGESLAGGFLEAAVCTDCHGSHGIRSRRDPRSSTHPTRVPATCGRCHSDPVLMGKRNHPADAEASYRQSVHGALLLEKGDLAAPQCASCHGNHGAVPPGVAEVGRVCGKCHVPQKEHFELSPHAFYARDGGFKECVTCHGNHRILREPAEMAGRCAPCHEKGDKELAAWGTLQGLLDSSRRRFQATSDRLLRLSRTGLETDEEQVSLEQARTSLFGLAPLQHTLSLDKVRAAAGEVSSRLEDLEARLNGREATERLKGLALVPLWIFLGAMALLFHAKRKRLEGVPRNDV